MKSFLGFILAFTLIAFATSAEQFEHAHEQTEQAHCTYCHNLVQKPVIPMAAFKSLLGLSLVLVLFSIVFSNSFSLSTIRLDSNLIRGPPKPLS